MYLAASTIVRATGETLMPAYTVKRFEGVPVAFIGLTLEGTPRIVVPDGRARPEVPRRGRDRQRTGARGCSATGVQAIVLLIHEGGIPTGGHNECPGISGPIVEIVEAPATRPWTWWSAATPTAPTTAASPAGW